MNYIINSIFAESLPHQHSEYEIIIITKGTGICSATEDYTVSQGDILIIPPNTIHRCSSPDTLERIYIRGAFRPFFSFSAPVHLREDSRQEGLILAKMIYTNRYASPEYLSALVDAFLHFLLQTMKKQDKIHIAVTHIIHSITNNFYDCGLDLKALLDGSGYAEDYIRAQFKKATGKTPVEFLTQVRVRHACCLIDTYGKSVPLSEIAFQCGYTDYVYFSKKFKAVTGVSPRTYVANTFAEEQPVH